MIFGYFHTPTLIRGRNAMRRGDHPQDERRWVQTPSLPTATDRAMRIWFAPLTQDGKLPCTGMGTDAVKYYLGKDYRVPVGTVTAQTLDMVQRLAQSEEEELNI
jgi:hypothetical protein